MPTLSLSKMVDLALGTPEVGAVNFNILHSLLHAMIKQLQISDVTADISENDRDFLSGPEKLLLWNSLSADSGKDDSSDEKSDLRKYRPPYHQLESKVARLADQLDQLNALPSTDELFQKIKATGDRPTPMQDLWQSMQISKRVGANEDGVGKLMTMVEDLMREMSELKDGYKRMDDLEAQMKLLKDENNKLQKKIDNLGMDDLVSKLNDLDSMMKDLNKKFGELPDLSHVPSAEEFAGFVTWPGLEDALNGVKTDLAELERKHQDAAFKFHDHQAAPIMPQRPPSTPIPSQTDVRSRPNSSRPSTRMSSASSGPSEQILDLLERLGKIYGEHDVLSKRVDVLEDEMKNKVDKDFLQKSLDGLNLDLLGDLSQQLEQIKTDIANLQKEMQQNREQEPNVSDSLDGQDIEALMRAQQAIHRLREDVDKLQITTQDIISDNDTKTKQIESLFQYCDKIQDVKADKEYVAMEVDVKADKRHLEGKVNHSLFDSTTSDINRLIKEIQDKLNGNEFDWQDAIAKLSAELESKLDRMELNSLKEWLESRLKALNQKIKQSGRYEEDDAAGLRRQLLQRFHCISCDRPVDILANGPVQSIPPSNSLPATRSPRPYTTYELDQIRQHAKSLQNGGALLSSYPYLIRQQKDHVMGKNQGNYERALTQRQNARLRKTDLKRFLIQQYQSGDVEEIPGQDGTDFYVADRPCGGSHTLTYPHKRINKMSHLGNLFPQEPVVPSPAPVAFKHDSELDILGVDGHIYKGRVDKQDPSRRHPMLPNYGQIDRSPTMSSHLPIRPSTSAGVNKPPPTPIPPNARPRPTSAMARPSSGGMAARGSSSARLTMRPQSARASSHAGSVTSSPPPEEPREFLQADRQVEGEEETEAVEIPVDTPQDEIEQSANQEY